MTREPEAWRWRHANSDHWVYDPSPEWREEFKDDPAVVFEPLFSTVPDQQLVARIKRSSKYWGQTAPNAWFSVRVVANDYYHLRGNNNNYRLIDVSLGVRLVDGAIVDLKSGKVSTLSSQHQQGE